MAGKKPKAGTSSARKTKAGKLTAEDRKIWQQVAASVTPLEKMPKADVQEEAEAAPAPSAVRAKPPPLKPVPQKTAAKKTAAQKTAAQKTAAQKTAPPGAGLDRRSAERLRRGQYPIEGRLDLHGLTVERAHRRLDQFISQALASDKRMVLVITGKGRAGGEGVLRREVPIWLKEGDNRDRVLAFQHARPADGGTGALYVLLRRNRAVHSDAT